MDKSLRENLAKNLMQVLRKEGLSYAKMQRHLKEAGTNISNVSVGHYFKGGRAVSIEMLIAIINVFNNLKKPKKIYKVSDFIEL